MFQTYSNDLGLREPGVRRLGVRRERAERRRRGGARRQEGRPVHRRGPARRQQGAGRARVQARGRRVQVLLPEVFWVRERIFTFQ